MSKGHKNPYRKGCGYNAGFDFMQKHSNRFTRSDLVAVYQKLGLKVKAALASATVLLSPREKDGRGDKRGNFSAMGHIYFVVPLKHVKGQEKAFALRWRKAVLARREYKRVETKSIKQEKITKAPATKAPATKETVTA
jgi:hypothetical protein